MLTTLEAELSKADENTENTWSERGDRGGVTQRWCKVFKLDDARYDFER